MKSRTDRRDGPGLRRLFERDERYCLQRGAAGLLLCRCAAWAIICHFLRTAWSLLMRVCRHHCRYRAARLYPALHLLFLCFSCRGKTCLAFACFYASASAFLDVPRIAWDAVGCYGLPVGLTATCTHCAHHICLDSGAGVTAPACCCAFGGNDNAPISLLCNALRGGLSGTAVWRLAYVACAQAPTCIRRIAGSGETLTPQHAAIPRPPALLLHHAGMLYRRANETSGLAGWHFIWGVPPAWAEGQRCLAAWAFFIVPANAAVRKEETAVSRGAWPASPALSLTVQTNMRTAQHGACLDINRLFSRAEDLLLVRIAVVIWWRIIMFIAETWTSGTCRAASSFPSAGCMMPPASAACLVCDSASCTFCVPVPYGSAVSVNVVGANGHHCSWLPCGLNNRVTYWRTLRLSDRMPHHSTCELSGGRINVGWVSCRGVDGSVPTPLRRARTWLLARGACPLLPSCASATAATRQLFVLLVAVKKWFKQTSRDGTLRGRGACQRERP